LAAQKVIDVLVYSQPEGLAQIAGWHHSWLLFSAYALVVAVLFGIIFRYKHVRTE
jgi:uncharacterized sodium:solute symporter family permease YidK